MRELPFATREVSVDGAKQLVIHPLSDVHVGAERHDSKRLRDRINEIKQAGEHHRVLLMGDLADTAVPINKHYEPGSRTPQEELGALVEIFQPISERIDLIIPGNHEERLLKVGLDLTMQFAALIGRPDVYRPLPTLVRYSFYRDRTEERRYRARAELYVHHGYGAGRNAGGKLDKVKALALQKPDAHVYLMGHVHTHATDMDEVPVGWPPRRRRRLYVITGTYQDSEAYAIKQNFPPGAVNSPRVYLDLDNVLDDVVASVKVG